MSLTNQERHLVTETFLLVAADIDHATEVFYQRLFETLPEARSLFSGTDMREQGRRLMRMLDMAIESTNKQEVLKPEMEKLAKRHVGYGVKAEYYQPFGEALIWTLSQLLREKFTPEIKAAWEKAFQILTESVSSS